MKSTARKKLSQEEAGTQTTAEERRQEMEKVTKENAGARKGRKVAKHCVFPVFCGSGGSKSRLAKAAAGQTKNEKLHAGVAPRTFWSQNWQNRLLDFQTLFLWCHRWWSSSQRFLSTRSLEGRWQRNSDELCCWDAELTDKQQRD